MTRRHTIPAHQIVKVVKDMAARGVKMNTDYNLIITEDPQKRCDCCRWLSDTGRSILFFLVEYM